MNAEILGQYFHDFYQLGMTTSSGGNLSCRMDDGKICISPSQIDKGYLQAEDFAFLDLEGSKLGDNNPSMEYPFHLSIYNQNPDIRGIMHLHPPVFVALSLLSKKNPILKKLLQEFDLGYAEYAIPGSDDLGDEICDELAKGHQTILMQNHGMIAVGKDLDEIKNRILSLNRELISILNLSSIFSGFEISGNFKDEPNDNCSFYENRAQHFLSTDKKIPFLYNEDLTFYYGLTQLKSLQQIGHSNFSTYVIPESFLLLKNPLVLDEIFNADKIQSYLKLFNTEISLIIFKDDWTLCNAVSPYKLYDKLEVLDFTAKVILYAQKMGEFNLLSSKQIKAIEQKFFN
jgi:ribulose-5-phosphate 4-epimerase/fuculose-1-phosphate aldolase